MFCRKLICSLPFFLLLLIAIQGKSEETQCQTFSTPTNKIHMHFQTGLKEDMKIEFGKFSTELEKLTQAQKELNHTIFELPCYQKTTCEAAEQALVKISALSSQNDELKNYIDNEIIKALKSLPKNKIEFDENLNCISNCGCSNDLPQDCDEAFQDNHQKDGVYVLQPYRRGLRAFGAYCKRHEGNNWTIIQRRQDGSVDFFKNWDDYANGFGDLYGEYWMGLDRIHALTYKKNYDLWIHLESYENGTRDFILSKFSVAGEDKQYKLKVGDTVSGYLKSPLWYNNGEKFSTHDRDNEWWKNGSCAHQQNGAWWYASCNGCNLNGKYRKHFERTGNGEKAIFCGEWPKRMESLKYVHMAIRPS